MTDSYGSPLVLSRFYWILPNVYATQEVGLTDLYASWWSSHFLEVQDDGDHPGLGRLQHRVTIAVSSWRPRQPCATTEPPKRLGPQVRPGRWFANIFFENRRRPAGCRLPSTATSRRCRDQPRFWLLRLRPELPSVRHIPHLPHTRD